MKKFKKMILTYYKLEEMKMDYSPFQQLNWNHHVEIIYTEILFLGTNGGNLMIQVREFMELYQLISCLHMIQT